MTILIDCFNYLSIKIVFHINYNNIYPWINNKQRYFIKTKCKQMLIFEYIKTFNLSKYQFMYIYYKNKYTFQSDDYLMLVKRQDDLSIQ